MKEKINAVKKPWNGLKRATSLDTATYHLSINNHALWTDEMDYSHLIENFDAFNFLVVDVNSDEVTLVIDKNRGAIFIRSIFSLTTEDRALDARIVLKTQSELADGKGSKYDHYRNKTEELSVILKAYLDAGFCRAEAIKMIKATLPRIW